MITTHAPLTPPLPSRVCCHVLARSDTAMMLLLLLIFAVAASGYVLKKGIEAGNKSKYQLLLHCVLIITRHVHTTHTHHLPSACIHSSTRDRL